MKLATHTAQMHCTVHSEGEVREGMELESEPLKERKREELRLRL